MIKNIDKRIQKLQEVVFKDENKPIPPIIYIIRALSLEDKDFGDKYSGIMKPYLNRLKKEEVENG